MISNTIDQATFHARLDAWLTKLDAISPEGYVYTPKDRQMNTDRLLDYFVTRDAHMSYDEYMTDKLGHPEWAACDDDH